MFLRPTQALLKRSVWKGMLFSLLLNPDCCFALVLLEVFGEAKYDDVFVRSSGAGLEEVVAKQATRGLR